MTGKTKDEISPGGDAPDKNAVAEIKKLQKSWQEDAGDSLFLKDVEDIESAFENADAETARSIG